MSGLDEQIRDIQQRIGAAQRVRARAEHQLDAATAAAERAATALRDEFGVCTVDEAKAVLFDLNRQLTEEIAALTTQLEQIGA